MSKRIFIDTNIMLDFLGERKPFYDPIAKIATLAEKRETDNGGFTNFFCNRKLLPYKI